MKQLTVIALFLFCFVELHSQTRRDSTWNARLNKAENRLSNIEDQSTEAEIAGLKEKLDFQQRLNEQTLSTISNQLESASYSLNLFGVLFSIAAIGLGIYVTYVEKKIARIGDENRELLAKNQKIKEEVESLNRLIQNDIYGLFLKIKREESVHILDRLVRIPKDIANLGDALLSRELEPDDFTKLRRAYFKLGTSDNDYRDNYKGLFFQHFLAQTLKDEQLRKDISGFIHEGIQAAFENDIIKSTSDFAAVLVDKGIQEYKLEINLFFKGLTGSPYKEYSEVYQALFDNLRTRKNRFDTFNVVESANDKRLAKIMFGNLLLSKYAGDNPTESEVLVFDELKALLAAQKQQETPGSASDKDN